MAHLFLVLAFSQLALNLDADETTSPDIYEPDGSVELATPISIDVAGDQSHNLHIEGDSDWFQFLAVAGVPLELLVTNIGARPIWRCYSMIHMELN